MRPRHIVLSLAAASLLFGLIACADDSASGPGPLPNIGDAGLGSDTSAPLDSGNGNDSGTPPKTDAGADSGHDAGKVLAPGLLDPIPYTSFADNPFNGVAFPSYFHFEDWEDGALSTPGVTSSSNQLGTAFGASLVDSVDGDHGKIHGKCEKPAGTCNDAFANGTIEFTFDAAALGALPTHVGIAWTDGSTGADAIFEAYDATDTLIGSKTADDVGDNSNSGTTAEDRFFGVVHAAGVKRIVVKSSGGGVEVDHLTYGR